MMIKLNEEDIIEAITRYIKNDLNKEVYNINFEEYDGSCISNLSAECFIKEGAE